jgi:predicted nucleic acid-binding protein
MMPGPVLVDTTVLSLAFRRRDRSRLAADERAIVDHFVELSDAGDIVLIGMVRQELLSGVRTREQFDRLRATLDGSDYLDLGLADHDHAAEIRNACRARGVAGDDIDVLVCAAGSRRGVAVFSTDPDFERYAACVTTIRLYSWLP